MPSIAEKIRSFPFRPGEPVISREHIEVDPPGLGLPEYLVQVKSVFGDKVHWPAPPFVVNRRFNEYLDMDRRVTQRMYEWVRNQRVIDLYSIRVGKKGNSLLIGREQVVAYGALLWVAKGPLHRNRTLGVGLVEATRKALGDDPIAGYINDLYTGATGRIKMAESWKSNKEHDGEQTTVRPSSVPIGEAWGIVIKPVATQTPKPVAEAEKQESDLTSEDNKRFLQEAGEIFDKENQGQLVSTIVFKNRLTQQFASLRYLFDSVYTLVREEDVLDIVRKMSPGRTTPTLYFNRNTAVTYAAMVWQENKLKTQHHTRKELLDATRASVAPERASLIHDLKSSRKNKGKQPSRKTVPIAESWGLKDNIDDTEARSMSKFQGRVLEDLDERAIGDFYARLDDRMDIIDFDKVPKHIVQPVMFIAAVARGELDLFDEELEGLTMKDLKRGLNICTTLFDRYPDIENLKKLRERAERAVEKRKNTTS